MAVLSVLRAHTAYSPQLHHLKSHDRNFHLSFFARQNKFSFPIECLIASTNSPDFNF